MLTEIYIEALIVDEELADQVWSLWGAGLITDDMAAWTRLFRVSADQGNPLGQTNVGFLFEKGWGVPKDRRETARLYRLAMAQSATVGRSGLQESMCRRLCQWEAPAFP